MKFTADSDIGYMISLLIPSAYSIFLKITNKQIENARIDDLTPIEAEIFQKIFILNLNFWSVVSDGIRPI